jgi:hypothetical protein
MAIDNAVEGCVRETFGALLATYQAATAKDPVIRAAMKQIARDETRHAALAWKVASWLNGRLAPTARERVKEARRAAAMKLLGARHQARPEMARLGLPNAPQATSLVAGLFDTMWS